MKLKRALKEIKQDLDYLCKQDAVRAEIPALSQATTNHTGTEQSEAVFGGLSAHDKFTKLELKIEELGKDLEDEKAGGWGKEYFEVLEKDISELRDGLKEAHDRITQLGQTSGELRKEFEAYEERLRREMAATKTGIDFAFQASLSAEREKFEGRITKLEEELKETDEQAEEVCDALTAARGEINKLQFDLGTNEGTKRANAIRSKIEKLELWVAFARPLLEPPTGDDEGLQQRIENLQNRIKALEIRQQSMAGLPTRRRK